MTGVKYKIKRLKSLRHGFLYCLSAFLDKREIGSLEITVGEDRSFAEIDNVGVLGEYQKMGIGKEMVKRAEKFIREKFEISDITIPGVQNTARGFWKKLDYKTTGERISLNAVRWKKIKET